MSRILSFPGFLDVHVHFRDPGGPEAETTASGLAAAGRGGFAAVVTMPNTSPACDSPELIAYQREAAAASGSPVKLYPSACLTKGRLGNEVADLERLAEAGAALFTDDGSYVADDRVMEEAMRRAARLGMTVADHAMDPSVLAHGVIRDCPLARRLELPVIAPETETKAIGRDLSLCRMTGCPLHIQHISTAEGVEMIRSAQREGLPVTAEATPHHLLFACEELSADDARYKMAPPVGNREDRAELRRAVKEGVLLFATDHAPHPAATKAGGFRTSANGITGLEAAVAVTYTVMVVEEGMEPAAWARAWTDAPRALLRNPLCPPPAALPETRIEIGGEWTFSLADSVSRSRNCPYDGYRAACRVLRCPA